MRAGECGRVEDLHALVKNIELTFYLVPASDTLLRHSRTRHRTGTTQLREGRIDPSRDVCAAPSSTNSIDAPSTILQASQELPDTGSSAVLDARISLQSEPQPTFQCEHGSEPSASNAWPVNSVAFASIENPVTNDDWSSSHQSVLGDPWLLSSDFDLAGIETDIMASISDWAGDWAGLSSQFPGDPAITAVPESATRLEYQARSPSGRLTEDPALAFGPLPCEDLLSGDWFNRLQSRHAQPMSRITSEGPNSDSDNVNESHRQDLSKALHVRTFSGTLPSVDFLNLALELFFERFHPTFPIVHKATFRPERGKALLLLSMCSIGSLFIGREAGTAIGIDLFRRLNKVILASWEQHMCRGLDALSMVQAAILGQTFGFLSGTSNDVFMAEAFHGTLLSWVRKVTSPTRWVALPIDTSTPEGEHDSLWRSWSLTEQNARLNLALRIHDAELAAMFHRHPLLRHHDLPPSFSHVDDTLFEAPNAQTWFRLQQETMHPEYVPPAKLSHLLQVNADTPTIRKAIVSSSFAKYSLLESIHAYILDARSSGSLMGPMKIEISAGLSVLWPLPQTYSKPEGIDKFGSRALWHLNFMSLSADFDLLERAIGRDGTPSQSTWDELHSWAASIDSPRCMFHALLFVESVEAIRFGQEPAIHIGRGLFYAGLLWTSLARLSHRKHWSKPPVPTTRFPELLELDEDVARVLTAKSGVGLHEPYKKWSGFAYQCSDLLRRACRWGLSDSFSRSLVVSLQSVDDPSNVGH